ncbi:hypothetical protein [Defluviimonas sp. WL0075]|uniref:Uncharacterized protein n=1 Tax=Albidovulum sediminicola TaxID=2984331 RepID=A0ABT2YXA7_9RHOB|nr:hypothetical protein [Defluviimonas sp. WL0075]MCV2863507.1 hypothetical protein [Defluviimonas sp. WL0075]
MKRSILAAAALTFAAAGAASAMTDPGLLSATDLSEARQAAPTSDLSGLTHEQVRAIEAVLYSSDENIGAQIRAILN